MVKIFNIICIIMFSDITSVLKRIREVKQFVVQVKEYKILNN